MRASRGLVLFLFFISILASGSLALTFEGPETIDVCNCQTLHYTLSFSADEAGDYEFTASGEAADWLTLHPRSVAGPGAHDIQAYITAPCSAEGRYTLPINVTRNDETWQLEETIHVTPCDDFTVSASWQDDVCPCGTEKVRVDITNNNPITRQVTLQKGETPAGPITFAPSTATIRPGKTGTLTGFMDLSCGYAGEFAVPFTIKSDSSVKTYRANLTVNRCDNLSLTHPPQATICEGERTALSLTVENEEQRPLAYRFSAVTPYANISSETYSLNASDQREHSLYLMPKGTFGNDSAIFTLNGPFRVEQYQVPVHIRNCHRPEVSFYEVESHLAMNISNTGSYTRTYLLSMSPARDIYSQCSATGVGNRTYCGPVQNITLEGNQSVTLFVKNTSLREGVTLSLQPQGEPLSYTFSPQKKRDFGLLGLYVLLAILLILLLVTLLRRRGKTKTRRSRPPRKVRKARKNGGAEKSTQADESKGEQRAFARWLRPLLVLLVLALIVGVLFLLPLGRFGVAGYFSNLFSPGAVMHNLTTPEDENLTQNVTHNASENISWGENATSNLTPGVPDTSTANASPNMSQASPYADESCFVTWRNSERLELNLSSYFHDPDGDTLNISITEWPEHINVSLEDEQLVLYPASFEGRDALALSATDGFGGNVSTGDLVICARDGRRGFVTQVLSYVDTYRYYVVLGFVLLVIIIMVTHLLERKQPEKNE